MPRADKTLDRMRAALRLADRKPEGGSCRPSVHIRKSGRSHVVFKHPGVAEAVSVPARWPIKSGYVGRSAAYRGGASDRPLTEDEGGGYLVEFPDLPGCMSDGETIEKPLPMAKTRSAAGSRQ